MQRSKLQYINIFHPKGDPTEIGGFLRSMNPLLFKKAKNGERLILQVSRAVVLPPEMGYNGVDILVKWAKVGPDMMLFQAIRLMPMKEVTGKTLQQAAWKGEFEMEVLERLANLFMYCFGIVKIRNYRSILEISK